MENRALTHRAVVASLALAINCVSSQAGMGVEAVKTPPAETVPATAKPAAAAAAAEAARSAAKLEEHKREIKAARAQCEAVLKGVTVVAVSKDPIEDGECGAPAPVELVSTGKNPVVALLPTGIVTCDLAVALHDWIKADVQPLAIKYLGTPVVRVETMSSYSCRHAYGRAHNKLSEHGKANALDIRGFVTAGGETAYVLEDWGPTSAEIAAASVAAQKEAAGREIAAVAAAKAKAEADARLAAAAKPPVTGGQVSKPSADPLAISKAMSVDLPGADVPNSGVGLAPPNKLGGPGEKSAGLPPGDAVASAKSLFLRAVHDSACHRFGTTLGPEANAAHRNHLHVDLAERKVKMICE